MNHDLNRFFTLNTHLRNAMRPCYRNEEGKLRWCCTNVDTMTQVVHAIDAFHDCIPSDGPQPRLLHITVVISKLRTRRGKWESVACIFMTLGDILLQQNEAVVNLAKNVFAKVVNNIPTSVFENLVLCILNPISSSISSCPVPMIVSSAYHLNLILGVLNSEREPLVWKLLEERKTVDNIINHICSGRSNPVSFFLTTINLLSSILWRWSSTRFRVWNNSELMEVLKSFSLPGHSLKDVVVDLYSTIALCNNGAKELLDSGNPSLQLMVNCMGRLNPDYLKLAGFRLAKCFVGSEKGRIKMIESYCEPLVKAIIDGLSNWSLLSEHPTKDQMSLIKGACCVSEIICWPGKHHVYFWVLGIESVLLKLLLPESHIKQLPLQFLSLDEQITTARNGLRANFLHELQPHVWDILGGLAAHRKFNAQMLNSELHLKILITCACICFVDSLCSVCEKSQNDVNEQACRAVLLMIYSPSTYIESQVKFVLSGMWKPKDKEYVNILLSTLKEKASHNLQVIKLISLACYSGLATYRLYVRNDNGINILLSYIEELYRNRHNTKRLRMNTNTSSHFWEHNKNMCCYECEEDWVGDELVFFGLLGLAVLVNRFRSCPIEADITSIIQDICINYSASGPRWYAAYILSHLGVYGFPSKFGYRIGNVSSKPEDVKVDDLVVRIRCKQLQSAHDNVDQEASKKLLEYVYKGYLKSENRELVKCLEKLAKRYNLQALSQMLGRSRPIWRTPFPRFDLTSAREPGADDLLLSDIILVAKGKTFDGWKCETCVISQPHLHCHKDILCLSCEHIHGMLRSGMQESYPESIEVDIGWEALVKLVNWFYSGEMVPKPKHGCLWLKLDENEKVKQIIPYVELYSLSNLWLLEDLHQECKTVISTCLDMVDLTALELDVDMEDILTSFLESLNKVIHNM